MSIAERNALVSICNPVAVLKAGGPGYTETFPEVAKEWMSVKPIASRERYLYGGGIGTVTHMIESPWNELITTKSHLIYEGRTFHIQSVIDKDDLHVDMEISAVEQTAKV
jgi:SPP1 family predicted phage head-tail adaptor